MFPSHRPSHLFSRVGREGEENHSQFMLCMKISFPLVRYVRYTLHSQGFFEPDFNFGLESFINSEVVLVKVISVAK